MPSHRGLPNPGIEPKFLVSPASAGGFFTIEPLGIPLLWTSAVIAQNQKNNLRLKYLGKFYEFDMLGNIF